MCQHLRDKNIELSNANCDSKGIWRFTCNQCGKEFNYSNVALVSLADVINLHYNEMQNLKDITGIKIYLDRKFQ